MKFGPVQGVWGHSGRSEARLGLYTGFWGLFGLIQEVQRPLAGETYWGDGQKAKFRFHKKILSIFRE